MPPKCTGSRCAQRDKGTEQERRRGLLCLRCRVLCVGPHALTMANHHRAGSCVGQCGGSGGAQHIPTGDGCTPPPTCASPGQQPGPPQRRSGRSALVARRALLPGFTPAGGGAVQACGAGAEAAGRPVRWVAAARGPPAAAALPAASSSDKGAATCPCRPGDRVATLAFNTVRHLEAW